MTTKANDPSPDIDEVASMRKVRSEQFEQETAIRLRDARRIMATDPVKSRDDLKELLSEIGTSDDLSSETRNRLDRQIVAVIRESTVRIREKNERDLANARRQEAGRERGRLDGELRRREDKIKQLTQRFDSLLEEGIRVGYQQPTQRFTEAEREVAVAIAEEAPPIYARPGVPMTARMVAITTPIVARILDYDTENMRNRREMQRGFMDALHLADIAGIPFPDEPPLVYPKADRWREITRLREKYKSVDLANPGSTEQKIYDALEQIIEPIDFIEAPSSRSC